MDPSFPGLETVINVATVVVGALLGMAVGHRFPDRTRSVVTDCLGLTTLDGSSRSVENVLSLARMSEASGINIVLGTGHYRDPYLDTAWFDQHGVEQIAEYMVADIQDGISGTGVRAGIIGEIGSDKWFTSSLEERSFRAAGRAHSATGVAVTTHAAKWPVGLEQIAILKDEGVDPARIIVGHCDTVNIPEYHVALATAGVFVQFDNIRRSTPYDLDCRVRFVVSLVRKGFLDQILLSHDVCKRAHLNISGGGGFDFVPTDFSAALRSAGLGAEEINHMLVDNPRRALTGER